MGGTAEARRRGGRHAVCVSAARSTAWPYLDNSILVGEGTQADWRGVLHLHITLSDSGLDRQQVDTDHPSPDYP